MAYSPNFLSGKNGAVFLYTAGVLTATGGFIPAVGSQIPATNPPASLGAYATTWAFGKWKLDIETSAPKVTNFTGVANFGLPWGIFLGATSSSTSTQQLTTTNIFSSAFQQNVQGVTKASLTLDGPYDAGNMPLVSGLTYVFVLQISGTSGASLITSAIITKLSPVVDIEDGERIQVSAESNGYFYPAVY